jgi:hypothetical protein
MYISAITNIVSLCRVVCCVCPLFGMHAQHVAAVIDGPVSTCFHAFVSTNGQRAAHACLLCSASRGQTRAWCLTVCPARRRETLRQREERG